MTTVETPASTVHLRAVVSLEALRRNPALVRRRLPADAELIACVKASAYGHGLRAVAACREADGVRWLSRGSSAEALALRRWGIGCDILLFPTGGGGDPKSLLEAGVTLGVESFDEAAGLARVNSILVQKTGQKVRVAGQDVPVLSVSPEHAVVDLSAAGSARAGASVCLLASRSAVGPSLADVASSQGRSPLEVPVSLTGRAGYEYSEADGASA